MHKTVSLRRNADNTLTVRVGKHVEHVGTLGKTHGQVFDAVKYAIISKGINLSDYDVIELLRSV